MTDEELATLMQETSEEIEQLADDPEKPLSKEEKKRKLVLQLKIQVLEKIQAAKAKGNMQQEIRAGVDYALLEKYGEKHPFLLHFLKSQMGWWYGF
jgi:hypothetical protein